MKRNSTIFFNIIISVIVFLTFLVIAEITFRTTHLFGARISWAKPDSLIANRYVPGAKYWHNIENDHPITGKINSHGWRDKERSLRKPPDTYRIACLGDSYLDAFQVELDSHFLARTEIRLNSERDHKIELLNFGRSGCTQTEELLILQNDAIKFDPDLVILFFLPGNDIEDVSKETATDI